MKKQEFKILKQYRNINNEKDRGVIGFDTETIKGYAVLLCNSKKECVEIKKPAHWLNFLFKKEYKKTLNLFYNIDFDFSGLTKWFGRCSIKRLIKYDECWWNGYKIEWITGKNFRITKGNIKIEFFDLYNIGVQNLKYFKTHKKTLNECCKFWEVKRQKTGEAKNFPELWKKDKEKAKDYCINDCQMVEETAYKIIEKLKSVDLKSYKWYSWGKLAEIHFIKNSKIPTINKIDKEMLYDFQKAYKGNWVELLQKGYFEDIYEYDINSAYPYSMAHLINHYKGFWFKRIGYDKLLEKCDYACICCQIEIENEIIPFITIKNGEKNINPCGYFETFITKNEYDIIKDKIIKIKYFYGFISYNKVYFLKNEIEKLYKLRKDNEFLKIVMNSIYGKFCQINDKRKKAHTGTLWNSINASFITTFTRKQIYNVIRDFQQDIISINTDCIYSRRPLNINNSKQIGGWKVKEWSQAIFLANGIYYLKNSDNDIKQSIRGFTGDLYNKIQDNLYNQSIEFEFKAPLSLRQALRLREYSEEDINEFVKEYKRININNDYKRLFPNVKNIKELINYSFQSVPLYLDKTLFFRKK